MTYRTDHQDRRWLDWHYTLPREFKCIDLDAALWCHRCRHVLALIELTTNPEKYTTVLARLAKRANVEAWLIVTPAEATEPQFTNETKVTAQRINSPEGRDLNPIRITLADWADYEARIVRGLHRCAS